MTFDDPRAYVRLANGIRKQIMDGELKPGNPIPITRINQETGHARHTVSKALHILEQEGLIKRYPRLGYCVIDSTPAEDTER